VNGRFERSSAFFFSVQKSKRLALQATILGNEGTSLPLHKA